MNTVMIVESFAYGTAKSVKQLASLLKQDHEITVFHGKRDGTELELQDLDGDVRWVPLPGRGVIKHLVNLWYLYRTIPRDTAIIHGHSTFGGVYARLLSLVKRNATVLYSPRGYAFLRQDFSKWVRSTFWLCERSLAPLGTTIACGPSEADIAAKLQSKAETINNGFDVPMDVEVDAVGTEILSIGRISIQKGFDVLKQIAINCPNQTFVWVGSADESSRELLENVPENVQLIPCMPHDQMIERLRNARFILLPSRWEGLSRVLVEGLGHGKALVTSRFPANMDCLCDDTGDNFQFANGFACDNLQQYVHAIQSLVDDDPLVRQMQTASHKYAKESYHMARIADQWRRLYTIDRPVREVVRRPFFSRRRPRHVGT